MIIDGAIGDFACQVSRHPWGEDTACLICLFRPKSEAAEEIASRETGLSLSRSQQQSSTVTDADVLAAPAEKQKWLRKQRGRRICSVIQSAMAQSVSEQQQRIGFQPSVPFVACLSASMIVTELVKYSAGWQSTIEPRYQMDVLQGPSCGDLLPQKRRPDCICSTRQKNINFIRNKRSQYIWSK
jgi:hypothetical protein